MSATGLGYVVKGTALSVLAAILDIRAHAVERKRAGTRPQVAVRDGYPDWSPSGIRIIFDPTRASKGAY